MGRQAIPEFRQARVCACGDHGFVAITRGLTSFFSPDRLADVEGYIWHAAKGHGCLYARAYIGGRATLMHVHLIKPAQKNEVDHRDGDGLNNRDGNLRECSHAENLKSRRAIKVATSSAYKGVSFRGRSWYAQIGNDGQYHYLGAFACPIEAARVYDAAAVKLHGDFAMTNAMLGLLPSEAE